MIKIGVVGTAGGWSSETLSDTVQRMTGFRLLVEMKHVRLDLDSGRGFYHDFDLTTLDALIIKKVGSRYSPDLLDRLEMLRFLNENGLNMFSKPLSILRILDRLSCTVSLRSAGIPLPPTTITENVDEAVKAVADYGEAVLKPLYTSKARGMKLLTYGPDVKETINAYKADNSILYIQKKIELPGKDLGLVFLGGNYVTTYARSKNNDSWNTTTRSGGKYEPYTPSDEIINLAQKAQALFNLDFTCVDIAETNQGPFVFEVSAFGGFRGIQTATGLDASQLLVDYVLKKMVQS